MKAKILQYIPSPLPLKKTLAERILQPTFATSGALSSTTTVSASDDFNSTGSGSNTSPVYPTGGGYIQRSSSSIAPIEIFEVHPHPASPLFAYVDYGSDDFHRMNSNPTTTTSTSYGSELNPNLISNHQFTSSFKDVPPPLPPVSVFLNHKDPNRQRIVIQNYKIRRTLKIISMMDITRDVIIHSLSNHNTNTKKISSTIPKADMIEMSHRLGYILNITFLDVNSSFISGGMMDTSLAAAQANPSFLIESKNQAIGDWVCEKVPPCIMIHFKSRIIVYSLANDKIISTTAAAASYYSPILSPIRANIGTRALKSAKPSSSTVIPIQTPNLLAIGCSDGFIRFYNIIQQKVVIAIAGPNGRNDPIVRIVSTNPVGLVDMNYHHEQTFENATVKSEHIKNIEESSTSMIHTTLKSRFLTVYASGDSFLWETTLTVNTRLGTVGEIKVRSPLCKFDFSWIDNNNQTTSALSSSSSYPISVDRSRIVYDPVRDLVLWTTINETLLGSKHYIFAWDISPSSLSKSLLLSSSHGLIPDKEKVDIPILRRCLTLLIPSNELSDPIPSESHVIPGLLHPSFSHSALVSIMGSYGGEFTLSVASFGSNAQQELSSSTQKLAAYHHFNLVSLLRSTDERIVGVWNAVNEDKIRIFSIHAGPQGDTVLLSTNRGTVLLRLEDELILQCGSRHVSVSVDNFGCHIGVGHGIIFVEESSFFYGCLNFKPCPAMPNPEGRMNITDMIPLYKSPPPLHKSIEFQNRPSRVSPRLLPSPSGEYLCAFWHAESRYEILHVNSLLYSVNTAKRRHEITYSPAVDTGVNVLSFAWVGDDDMFALLYPPEHSKDSNGSVTVMKERKRNSSRRITEEDSEDQTIYDPSTFLPAVEIKQLIGVSQSAVEISGSVGAATAVSLGDLQLRGRYSATYLFGGPVLCVASISDQKDTGHVDGAAFFYNVREDSQDKRASSFVTVGPSLPFPNYVEWDDDGKLCAIVVGRRVFVYISAQDNLTHLGSVQLGHAHEHDTTIQSVKFLHGSLYCSTQSTVQVIFIGNLDHENKICEIDSYLIASSCRPYANLSVTMDPAPLTIALNNPFVLSFFYGSLLISCASSIYSIPLRHPMLRIGVLLAAKQKDRADKWISQTNPKDHESLAVFLERRGEPELAVKLPGLSIATAVDLCLKYELAEKLEKIVENVGIKRIRDVDLGSGVNGSYVSTIVGVGSLLLGLGKVELVRCMATECLTFGDDRGRVEAFTLASLLIAVEPMDGLRLIKRAVGIGNKLQKDKGSSWLLGDFVRGYLLEKKSHQFK